jgi:hypothetical protein
MAGAQATGTPPAPQPIPQDRDRGERTLRWSYRRDGQVLTCALALTPDCSAYELRISPARPPLGLVTELFDDAICAFQRQVTLERALLADGWTLDGFEQRTEESGSRPDLTRKTA